VNLSAIENKADKAYGVQTPKDSQMRRMSSPPFLKTLSVVLTSNSHLSLISRRNNGRLSGAPDREPEDRVFLDVSCPYITS